jgi:hypothetical protein
MSASVRQRAPTDVCSTCFERVKTPLKEAAGDLTVARSEGVTLQLLLARA